MTKTDVEAIAHLDFEVQDTTAVPCHGYLFNNYLTGEITFLNKNCKTPPILIATRVCCGIRTHYCLDCYNFVCARWVKGSDTSGGVRHIDCGTSVSGRPFLSDVEFL